MNPDQATPLPFSVENNELNLHHRLLFELFDKVEESITGAHEAEVASALAGWMMPTKDMALKNVTTQTDPISSTLTSWYLYSTIFGSR